MNLYAWVRRVHFIKKEKKIKENPRKYIKYMVRRRWILSKIFWLFIFTAICFMIFFPNSFDSSNKVYKTLGGQLNKTLHQVDRFKLHVPQNKRANATFIALVRNSELEGMISTIKQVESTFNSRFNYPYVFLNDVEFTPEFKDAILGLTSAQVFFGVIPKEHWSLPSWVDKVKFYAKLKEMEAAGKSYGVCTLINI